MFHFHIKTAGFTLIELLMVIALLGAFAVGLLATIDPFEQLKKGSDASKADIASNVYTAMIGAYASRGAFPISENLIGSSLHSPAGVSLTQRLIQFGELKSNFLSLLANNVSKIFVTAIQNGNILSVCFLPESKSYITMSQSAYSVTGSKLNNCNTSACYYCIGENPVSSLAGSQTDTGGTDLSVSQTSTTDDITPTPSPLPSDATITRKVMVIDFNPIIESKGNKRLRQVLNWSDPITLESQFINDIREASGGYLTYQIVQRLSNIDVYPTKSNGYVFTDDTYFTALSNPDSNAHAIIDYRKLINDYDVCGRVNRGEIDELWLWGAPWFGYWEAVMAGPGAYFTNAPPITGTSCSKKLHIFGFSYERGISEMLEDFGHRTEGTMKNAFGGWFSGANTDWDRYTKSRSFHGSEGSFSYGCGSIHEPFNASGGYDWSNTTSVQTTCAGWIHYPPAPIATQTLNCSLWGCTGYGYIKMWLTNLPRSSGKTNGIWNSWWKYLGEDN